MPKPEKYTARDGTVTWRVRLRDPARGKFTSETFSSKRDAENFCRVVAAIGASEAIARRYAEYGEPVDPTTLDELFEGYIAWKATRVRSDRTVADYRRDYRNWIQPTMGSRAALAISEDAVQDWVNDLAGKLAPKSVGDRHSILHGIYQWASTIRKPRLVHNPCKGTDLPRRRKGQPKGLRPAEWQALHVAMQQIDPDAADLALFLVMTGWRFSEAIALCSYDIEDYGDAMFITVGRVMRRNAAGQHVIVEDDAKSEAGLRRIQASRALAAVIRRRLEKVPPGGLVFTTANGTQVRHGNFLYRAWNPAVKAANLARRPTPHWLRHSHVFWLSLTGQATIEQIQSRIGHEDITTTIGVYGSMITDVSGDALQALDRLISGDAGQRRELPVAVDQGTL